MSRYNTPRTPQIKEEHKGEDSEPAVWENLKCDIHPNFKIDAIGVNDNKSDIRLFCIKCMIEGTNYKVQEGDKLIAIRELIQKCNDAPNSNSERISKSKEEAQNQFLNFLTKDYAGSYDKHMENELAILESEMQELTDNINKLKNRYKEYYSKGSEEIKSSINEIKKRMGNFLEDDQTSEANLHGGITQVDIHKKLAKVSNKEDLLETSKWLYAKSKENAEFTSGDQKKINDSMENIKKKVEDIQDIHIDVSKSEGHNT